MNTFGARSTFQTGGKTYTFYRLAALSEKGHAIDRLPFGLKILLENLLRTEDGQAVTAADIEALASWNPKAEPSKEISFTPARTLLQDFTGVPCVVDLASMRDAMTRFGGDPQRINPLSPVELVIDHSVQVDAYGSEAAIQINRDLEYNRNEERYKFLKWGQGALGNFKAVPPNTGIVHQVNLEYLARVVMASPPPTPSSFSAGAENKEGALAYFDTLVGTDSHTTMVNGLGVLGWGVGGIEAEAAMLGQPVAMLIPQVVGFRLSGSLPEGATATDLVLTVTQMLRAKGVVGKFVEFYGPGVAALPVADRATLANMAPEYGATCGLFPIDEETLRYLRLTGRPEEQVQLVEAYAKAQGLFHTADSPEAEYTDTLSLDLSTVVPSMAGPKRPQDRVTLAEAGASFQKAFPDAVGFDRTRLSNGSVVIAAITSCTNTSNPSVMVAAGLVARKANALGLKAKPWVKTSLAPGSRVVTSYLKQAGLLAELNQQGFNVVGYGCTTCIGNSGPLPEEVGKQVREQELAVVSVLSGNRNFEGRVNADVKANYLASPPLVVAYALAGTINIDLSSEPIGTGSNGQDVYLKDIWPTQKEVADTVASCVQADMFRKNYGEVFKGDEKWEALSSPASENYAWDGDSTYIRQAPYFDDMPLEAPKQVAEIKGLRVLAMLGDSVTTDHISPAGSIKGNSPGGQYLVDHGVTPELFNSYGSRRGNHEVMVRGTFANVRLRNQLAPGTEGGFTTHFPSGEVTSIFEASERYKHDGTPLLVLAGKEYGTGSSRDWAAKGVLLLGVKAVIAESFERIHRSNLIGMGVLPLQYLEGQSAATLGLSGTETFDLVDLPSEFAQGFPNGRKLRVRATTENGAAKEFEVLVRLDAPQEFQYYRHGGILQYVLRQLLKG